jgi:integrase
MVDKRLPEFEAWLCEQRSRNGRLLNPRTASTYRKAMAVCLKRKSKLAAMKDKDKSYNTRLTYYAALIKWAEFTEDKKFLARMKEPRTRDLLGEKTQRMVMPLPEEDVVKFREALESLKAKPGVKVWVWPSVSLMLKLALRGGVDLCGIEREKAKEAMATKRLRLKTKGGKWRVVPAGTVRDELQAVLDVTGWARLADLISPYAKESTRIRAAYTAIWRAVREIAVLAEIDPAEVHPHRFRHQRAVELLTQTKRLELVQQLLGHADVRTTMGYVYADRSDEIDAALAELDS